MSSPNPLFRQAPPQPPDTENPYAVYGWTQNPFPDKPGVIPESTDPRLNGATYRADIRAAEQADFDRLLIHGKPPRSLAFLMDFATRRGRGIGKSAFLSHQCRRIMPDLGNSITDSARVLFAAYIVPPAEGRCRKFWQFSRLLAESLCEQGILARAIWRIAAFSGVIPDDVLADVGAEPQETIAKDSWLSKRNVNTFDLRTSITRTLLSAGIDDDIASKLAWSGSSSEELQKTFFDALTDTDWRVRGSELVFDAFVRLFTEAGFSHGILLVDDLERIVLKENIRERTAFAEDVRHFFVDGPHPSARLRFYSMLLTIHPYVQELLVPHWARAGLDRFCPISGAMDSEYTVYFRPLEMNAAEPLVLEYLDKSRLNPAEKGECRPFEKQALTEAMTCAKGLPGEMLQLLHHVVETAVREQWNVIRAEQIHEVYEREPPMESEQPTEKVALPPAKMDLMDEE